MTQNILLLLNTFYTYLVRINCSLSFRFRNNPLMLGDRVSISIRETKYSVLTMWTLEITSAQFTRRNWNLKTLPHHLLKCVISTLISRLAKTHPSVSASTIRERTCISDCQLSAYGQQHSRQSSLRCLYISTGEICWNLHVQS